MAIKIENLTIKFKGNITAVNQVNMEIENGIYGLLGENGAGKTTLMRALTTIITPDEGSLSLNGILYEEKNYEQIRRKIGYLPQELNLYPNLTVVECLEYLGRLSGISKRDCRERIDFYLEKTSLTEHRKKKNKQLSGGMKRRVGLIQALLHEPEFLIVDEPTAGLDPEERIRIRNLLVDFSTNRTILFSTHVTEDLAASCSAIAVMKKGVFLYMGSQAELLRKADGHVWTYCAGREEARELESLYCVSSKQIVEEGYQMKIISKNPPLDRCRPAAPTLEDAYIYAANQKTI